MSQAQQRIEDNVVYNPITTLPAGSPDTVLDVRGCTGFTPWFAAGTGHTAQPCDEGGTVLPGSASAALAAGTEVDVVSPFYRISVDAANDLTITKLGNV